MLIPPKRRFLVGPFIVEESSGGMNINHKESIATELNVTFAIGQFRLDKTKPIPIVEITDPGETINPDEKSHDYGKQK